LAGVYRGEHDNSLYWRLPFQERAAQAYAPQAAASATRFIKTCEQIIWNSGDTILDGVPGRSSGDTVPSSCSFWFGACVVLAWGRVSAVSERDPQVFPDDPETPNCPAADRFARVLADREVVPPAADFSRRLSSRRPSPTTAPRRPNDRPGRRGAPWHCSTATPVRWPWLSRPGNTNSKVEGTGGPATDSLAIVCGN